MWSVFLLLLLVFTSFLVFVGRYAAFYCVSPHRLFNLSIQFENNILLSTINFGMYRLDCNCNSWQWIERLVCDQWFGKIIMEFTNFLQVSIYFIITFFLNMRFLGLYSLWPKKFQLTYIPTHLRFSSWMIGVIAGYIFFKYQNRSIRIPKVKHQ